MDNCEDSDSNINYNKEDVSKVKEEVEDSAGDDCYTSVSDPLEIDIKNELENNLTRASAAESYTSNVDDPARVDPEILTVEGSPNRNTNEEITRDTRLGEPAEQTEQHQEGTVRHDECKKSTSAQRRVFTICHRAFTQSHHLVRHKRSHTCEKPYVCTVCQKTFSWLSALVTHKLMHTGKKPYICSVCQKTFSRSFALTVHERIHTGKKPYICSVSENIFSQSSTLAAHERIHTGNKPYFCNVCRKAFHR